MTCVAVVKTKSGAGFVADKRVLFDCSITTDSFSKLARFGNGRLTVGIAGDVGPAQVWLRAATKSRVSTIPGLLAEHVGGDFHFVVYDAKIHELCWGDSHGAITSIESHAVIGSGGDYVRGYVAAAGMPTNGKEAVTRLVCAIQECSKTNVSVSHVLETAWIARRSLPPKRAPSRKAARRVAA
jgi:hypothetical protein